MSTIVVTGWTGQLGAPVTAGLRAAGHSVRGLSRRGGTGSVACDLVTGAGLVDALREVDTVVHLATSNGSKDVVMAENLANAAVTAGVRHLVVMSIVGIEKIPIGFYRDRVRIEEILRACGVPLTVLRATQFHSFVERLFTAQRFSPVILGPTMRFQPISVDDVATRLVELAGGAPAGRVDDIGGPEQNTVREWHRRWASATGSRRPMVPIRLPIELFRALGDGPNLVPGRPFGHRTFEQYLAETASTARERS
ncbi:nucleotide-diphosphate-sugar epimerase [Rhodococcoides trifolii]|uniref:Nucleotide-diphosphate-sugar epimerase n=1 Tax=Rhodococcoides trifolii TaxID=908250 RepID=A0A917D2I0_9NOCA|nr:NmrA family NAD(P)-binding protein [Rhodococcus trifolii]GGG05693.1 nucleotide-diphosphate-sugar epimerase [Rhodococcus trifolii]